MKSTALTLLLFLASRIALGQEVDFRFQGLKIWVANLEESRDFYREVLGVNVIEDSNGLRIIDQAFPIEVEEASTLASSNYPHKSRTGLTFQVNKLLPAIDRFRTKDVPIYDTLLTRNGVGISIPFRDPSGNVFNIIEVQVYNQPRLSNWKVYNTGVSISNLDSAVAFYQDILGFEDWSRNYLPAALPLKHKDGSFAFMIHFKSGLKANDQAYNSSPQMALLLSTADIDEARIYLQNLNVRVLEKPNMLLCQDTEGNWLEIIEIQKN